MRKSALLGLGAVIALSALFLACGGSDKPSTSNDPGGTDTHQGAGAELSNIRIAKGLSVANISNNNSGNGAQTADEGAELASGSGGSGVAAPAADQSARSASSGYGGTGSSGGDIAQQASDATDNTGITVQGYGSATADADSAIVEFGFSSTNYNNTPYPSYKPDAGTAPAPIDKDTLQPVIDALVAAGVNADDIDVLSQSYYYDYYSSSATLRATVNNLDILDAAVEAAQGAAGNIDSVYLNSTNIMYTLQNCSALERAAAQAAVEDAGDRAGVLADVLNVSLGDVAGASDYSWYNNGTGCGDQYYSPWPIAYNAWRSGGSNDGTVQVVSNISVTYAFN